MKNPLLLIGVIGLLLLAIGCNNRPATPAVTETAGQYTDTMPGQAGVSADSTDIPLDENQTMYVVIADSGTDYWQLERTMFNLHCNTGLNIDTQGKSFNQEKGEITLAEDDEDEMWQGQHYPRRWGEDFLSLEQLYFYDTVTQVENRSQTMVLVAGLFDNRISADSLASVISKYAPATFVMQSSIYMGCMH